MTQVSGLKRSMPCEDLSSMTTGATSCGFYTPTSISTSPKSLCLKGYDSDDASATSCMELTSIIKLNNSILASYDDHFFDDVWDFQGIDFDTGRLYKRQKSCASSSLCPATEALTSVLGDSQDTLNKMMNLHIHQTNLSCGF